MVTSQVPPTHFTRWFWLQGDNMVFARGGGGVGKLVVFESLIFAHFHTLLNKEIHFVCSIHILTKNQVPLCLSEFILFCIRRTIWPLSNTCACLSHLILALPYLFLRGINLIYVWKGKYSLSCKVYPVPHSTMKMRKWDMSKARGRRVLVVVWGYKVWLIYQESGPDSQELVRW